MILYNFKKRPHKGLFLILLCFVSTLYSQTFKPRVTSVKFIGNNKTLDYIIEREIRHPIYVTLDSVLANSDMNRLENLGLFSQVEWKAIPLENKCAELTFFLTESIQKTPPIVLPTFEEDTGWSIAGLWVLNNYRGKNQSLVLGGTIGGKDTYGLQFSDPWIFGNHVSMNLELGSSLFKHTFLDKDIEVNSFNMSFGKWFGQSIKANFSFELEEKIFLNKKSKRSFFYFAPSIMVKYDSRDIYWNPGKGLLISQYLRKAIGIAPENFWLNQWNQSYSFFYRINTIDKKLVMGLNTSLNSKWGKKEELWLNYLGGTSTIRGWELPDSSLFYSQSQNFRFGHQSIYASMEVRYEIIPKYATSLGIETGLILVFFNDIGATAVNWTNIQELEPMHGTGIGIRVPFPIINVLRLDYGWGYRYGEWNSGAFHFGIGQKF